MSETRRILLPQGFDSTRSAHTAALIRDIRKQLGDGWTITHVDSQGGYAYAEQVSTIHEVTGDEGREDRERKVLRLSSNTKPSDGDKFAGWVSVRYPGMEVVEFRPYAFEAVIERLEPEVSRARSAITAALGCKPWDISISATRDKGGKIEKFDFTLPNDYLPSKHRPKLVEVAQVVLGNLGWRLFDNPREQTARIETGDPPMFPPIAPYPAKQDLSAWDRIPFGLDLYGGEVELVFTSTPSAQISGRSQPLHALIPVPISHSFPDGWATMGELAVGDEVYAGDGSVTTIDYLSPVIDEEVWEVEFDDGQVVECSPEHQWLVRGNREEEPRRITTLDLSREIDNVNLPVITVDIPRPAICGNEGQKIAFIDTDTPDSIMRLVTPRIMRGAATNRLAAFEAVVKRFGVNRMENCEVVFNMSESAHIFLEISRSLGYWSRLEMNNNVIVRLPPSPLSVVSVTPTGEFQPQRCLRVVHPEHTYLTAGFIRTSNTGSGKGICISSIITGCLIRGWEVAIIDATKGAVDFEFAHHYVRPSGWGCETEPEALAVAKIVYEEGQRRKALVKQHKVSKWTELPADLGLKPILVVLDEVSGSFTPSPMPKGVPKDHPMVTDVMLTNLVRAEMLDISTRIAKELRFVGIYSVQATQKWLASITGGSTELKANLGAKILLGPSATTGDRLVGLSDPDTVPDVPEYIRSDPEMSRGVGVYEFDGAEPGVFKGYYASQSEFESVLVAHGVPRFDDSRRPSIDEVARLSPTLSE